ncbi:MAG: carbon starvation protein A [Planctomycetota bacterium]|nr:MAG: carbon starvation protein A [Planctomycetota bacterium]
MTAALVVAASLAVYAAGYLFYSRWLATRLFELDEHAVTPAHAQRDDVDYLPTRPGVLFGHHYASITGLAPMLGPAVAVIWGWLPALLWVVLGAIFVGCVHDFAALVLSARHRGLSIGAIAEDLLGRRAKRLFHAVIFFGVALAMGVFVLFIAGLFAHERYPQAILPSGGLMLVAALIGVLLHSGRAKLLPATLLGFAALIALILLAVKLDTFGLSAERWPSARSFKLSLLGYGLLASVLPVWSLLQPRDFINSLLLYLGLLAMFTGFFLTGNDFVAPALVLAPEGAPSLFPFVFITIACGAASGFHALVSSGTTAKQLDNERHARPIGYGAMIAESLLGLLAVVACTAGVLAPEAWTGVGGLYHEWGTVRGPVALSNFIEGGASFLTPFGLSAELGASFVAVVVVSFALTTLDSATRLLRYNIEEISQSLGWKRVGTRWPASFLAVAAIGFFAFYTVSEARDVTEAVLGPDGQTLSTVTRSIVVEREAGLVLWALFGTTNQLLAAMTLLLATRYLSRRGKPTWATGVPMLIMFASTLLAMLGNLRDFWRAGDVPLIVVGGVLLTLALWLCVEGVLALRADRRERTQPLV